MIRLSFILLFVVCLAGCFRYGDDEQLVTYREYRQVKKDMTLGQVENLIGASGERKSDSGGLTQFVWMNKDGSGLLVTFKNGKTASKTSIGNIR